LLNQVWLAILLKSFDANQVSNSYGRIVHFSLTTFNQIFLLELDPNARFA